LNRGWRFCRPYRVVTRSAWLRLLVPDDVWFSLVFGRCCSEVAPKFRGSLTLIPFTPSIGAPLDRRGGPCSVGPKRGCRLNRGRSVRWKHRGHHRREAEHQADGDEDNRIVQIADRPLRDNLVEPHGQCETRDEARDDDHDRRLHRSFHDAARKEEVADGAVAASDDVCPCAVQPGARGRRALRVVEQPLAEPGGAEVSQRAYLAGEATASFDLDRNSSVGGSRWSRPWPMRAIRPPPCGCRPRQDRRVRIALGRGNWDY
jgi:hypothetical protein